MTDLGITTEDASSSIFSSVIVDAVSEKRAAYQPLDTNMSGSKIYDQFMYVSRPREESRYNTCRPAPPQTNNIHI